MSLLQVASDIGDAFNRWIQRIEEKFWETDKTEYDDEYTGNVKKLDVLMYFTEVLIDDTESMLEPNPASRLEGRIMDTVERRYEKNTPLETLGVAFESASRDVKQYNYELSKDFAICSRYQIKLGLASKEFQTRTTEAYVSKLKKMLYIDLKKYKEEKEILENLRLDYDSIRIRIKNAITVSGKENLEKEFVQVKKLFFVKLESNSEYFRSIDQFFDIHRELLKEFVESQSAYYKECHNELEKLKGKMVSRSLSSFYGGDSEIYQDKYSSKHKMMRPFETIPSVRSLNIIPEIPVDQMRETRDDYGMSLSKIHDSPPNPKTNGRSPDFVLEAPPIDQKIQEKPDKLHPELSGDDYDTIEDDFDEPSHGVLIQGRVNVNVNVDEEEPSFNGGGVIIQGQTTPLEISVKVDLTNSEGTGEVDKQGNEHSNSEDTTKEGLPQADNENPLNNQ